MVFEMNSGESGGVEIFIKVLILEIVLYLSISILPNKQANKRTNKQTNLLIQWGRIILEKLKGLS
jgi:hypothetical protein